MKGYAYQSPGEMGWVEKEKPRAAGIDAVVRPLMISPCTSDVHNAEMGYVEPGRILGHEGIAEVVETGNQVKDFKPGDIVAISPVTPDWRTVLTQKGVPQHCHGLLSGNVLSNSMDGLMAEYALVPDADMNLAHIPSGVDYAAAVMATDMMNTGFYGAELADVQFGDTVVVLGIGPVGLMAVAGARLRGAGRIIAVGSRPVCISAARDYGATDIVNYREEDVARQIYKLTDKQGADKCIIAGGDERALGQAVAMVRYGGTIGNVNYFTTPGDLSISNSRWGFGMSNKTIRCGMVTGGRARLEGLLSMVRYGRVDPLPLITHRYQGMEGIVPAFRGMAEKPPELIKTLVEI
ncbi:MAG TPA: zinc-binding dehydrogenase [Anaerovoracaceae bacterium]|nr:zinc-binding dehydrogenase [Anaerovoracaceae bacterium]